MGKLPYRRRGVYQLFTLYAPMCAASRTNSKKKSTLQPTLHFGDVCDLENAKSLQNVRNAGEPDSLTPIRHPNTDLSTHRAYLRHKCTDTIFKEIVHSVKIIGPDSGYWALFGRSGP